MSEVEPVGATAPSPRENPFQRVAGTLFNPSPTLRSIADRPDWLVPLLIAIAVAVAASWIVVNRMDLETAMREAYERAGMEPSQIDETVPTVSKIQKILIPTFALFGTPIIFAILAGLSLLAFKLLGGEGTFKKNFSIVAYTWLPQVIKSIIAAVLIFPRSDLSPEAAETLLKSNLAFLVSMEEQPVVFALLKSLDAFTIWWLVLLIIGLSYASKLSRGKVAAVVLILWGFGILLAVAAAAMSTGSGGM